jgi:hypothetical protein
MFTLRSRPQTKSTPSTRGCLLVRMEMFRSNSFAQMVAWIWSNLCRYVFHTTLRKYVNNRLPWRFAVTSQRMVRRKITPTGFCFGGLDAERPLYTN